MPDVALRPTVVRLLSECAGADGLGLGIELALKYLGYRARTVCFVEREARAAATLVARMAEKALDTAPVWDDITTFDGCPWRGRVDGIHVGFPCQPHSLAGNREGVEDDRWIFPDILRTFREIRPLFGFFENVPGILSSGGFDGVLSGLAALGYDAQWDMFSVEEVGGSQIRERVFVLALANARSGQLPQPWRQPENGDGARSTGAVELRPLSLVGPDRYAGLPLFPPGPGESARWREIIERWPELAPAIESDVRRVADGLADPMDGSRADRLRLTGNGVCPLQAAAAFCTLWLGWQTLSSKQG